MTKPICEWTPINKIKAWEKNPRLNDHVVDRVANSIEQFGFLNPIIVQRSSNRIVCGHTRHKASIKLKMDLVPVVFADIDDTSAKAYAIADNKLGELAEWDEGLLSSLVSELKEEQFDIDLLGFESFELDKLFPIDTEEVSILEDELIDLNHGKVTLTIEINEGDQDEILEEIKNAISGYEFLIK